MNEAQMKILITAREQVSKAFGNVNKQLNRTQRQLERLEPTFKKMRNVGAVTFTAFSVGMDNFARSGAKTKQLETEFARMTNSLGLNSDKVMKKIKEASANTISNQDLLLSSNKAMALVLQKIWKTSQL